MGSVSRDARDTSPFLCDGRHSDVATAGAYDEVSRLSRDFRGMSGQTLLTLSIGACQHMVGAVTPLKFPFSSGRDVLPADRDGHISQLRADHAIRSEHLAWVSHTINQLVAVEYALAEHVAASVNGIEMHESTDGDVCDGCAFTAAAFELSAAGSNNPVASFARNARKR